LPYGLYPPYGLITEAFIPVGTYLLLVRIFASAIHVSRDAVVRKELYISTINQLDLLRSIGTSEMEKDFEGKAKYLEKVHRISEFSERSEIEVEIEVENVKKILHEVLEEVHSKDRKKETDHPT
jgi:hypothetical protein